MLLPNWFRATKFALLGVALVSTASAWADETDIKDKRVRINIESYGDSLTAAFLSATDVTNPPSLNEVSKIVSDLARYSLTKNWKFLVPHHAPKMAWPMLLGGKFLAAGHDVRVANRAVSGAHTSDLASQVVSAPKDGSAKTIAFFFVGHNDLCGNNNAPTSIGTQFAAEYDQALAKWDSVHENDIAYLVPVGDIHRALGKLQGYVWYQGKEKDARYACEDSWDKLFPYCSAHSKLLKAGKLEEFMVPRLAAMNTQLERVAEKWQKESKRGNRFRYVKDAHDYTFEVKYFAVDCFHLSPSGQRFFADRAWNIVAKD